MRAGVLGRERHGSGTLGKALAHRNQAREALPREIRPARGDRRPVLRRRLKASEARIAVITEQIDRPGRSERVRTAL
jgi:hypothetical protein